MEIAFECFSSRGPFLMARCKELVAARGPERIIAHGPGFYAWDSGNFSLRGQEMLSTLPVLIVCSDSAQIEKTGEILRDIGLQPVICMYLIDARAMLEKESFQLIFCSDDLPDCNLRTALKVLSSATGGVPVIVLSHLADWDAYMKALSAGAFDYIAYPPERIETERIVRLALNQDLRYRRAS